MKFRSFVPIALACGVLAGAMHVRAQMWSPWVKGTPAVTGGGTTPTQWGNTAGVDRDTTITVSTTTQANDTVVGAATASNWGKARGTNIRPHLGNDANPRYHFEYIATTINTNGWIAGISDGADVLTEFCGQGVNGHSIGIQTAPSVPYIAVYYVGNTGSGTWGIAVANGDVIAVEVDLSAKLLWFQDFTKASGWSNANFTFTGANPGAGTGGVGYSVLWTFTGEGTTGVVPCWSGNLSSKGQMKTKLTAFSAPVSSGFTAWDPP